MSAVTAATLTAKKGGGVEVGEFETSLRPSPSDIQTIESIAIAPFDGDWQGLATALAERVQQLGTVRVISPFEFGKHVGLKTASPFGVSSLTEHDEAELAKNAGSELNVKYVLFGTVVQIQQETSIIGLFGKAKLPKQFRLRLVSVQEGSIVWKDALPFTILVGTKQPPDEEVARVLVDRLIERFSELGMFRMKKTE